jgi:hypothetical protein
MASQAATAGSSPLLAAFASASRSRRPVPDPEESSIRLIEVITAADTAIASSRASPAARARSTPVSSNSNA